MTQSDIFAIIQKNILDILPTLKPEEIYPEISMGDLGANSIDRADVIIQTMAELSLKLPLVEFAAAGNISGLVELFSQNLQKKKN